MSSSCVSYYSIPIRRCGMLTRCLAHHAIYSAKQVAHQLSALHQAAAAKDRERLAELQRWLVEFGQNEVGTAKRPAVEAQGVPGCLGRFFCFGLR